MKKTKKQENCHICGEKLNFWFTATRKVDGMRVCTKCHFKRAKNELDEGVAEVKKEFKKIDEEMEKKQQLTNKKTNKAEGLADKLDRWGKKLFVGLTIPIILFLLGLFTMPIGIIFWIIAVVMFMTLFTKDKGN